MKLIKFMSDENLHKRAENYAYEEIADKLKKLQKVKHKDPRDL